MRCKFLSAGSIGRERLRQSHWIEAQRGLKLVNKFKMARNSEKEATRQHNTTQQQIISRARCTILCTVCTVYYWMDGTFKDILN